PGELYVDAILATEGGAAAERVVLPGERARKKLGPVFWISVGWVALVILAAIFARFLPIKSYTETGVGPPRTHPNSQFWFGTDELGRDMLARVIYGARVSMVVGFASIFAAFIIGGAIGVIAGYYRGRV